MADPRAFNDPFELTPRVAPAEDDLIVEKLSSPFWITRYYETVGRANGLSEESSRDEYLAKVLPARIEEVIATKEERAKDLRLEFVSHVAKGFRLLCCSFNIESILMWAHYAEKHQGIVVEFETDELVKGQCIDSGIVEVRYRTSPPTMPSLEKSDDSYETTVFEVIGTKALQWSYEEEVRIIFPLPAEPKGGLPVEITFQPSSIKRIIVGCSMEIQSPAYRSMDGIANDADYRHVEFQRAYIHSHDYKLCFATRPH